MLNRMTVVGIGSILVTLGCGTPQPSSTDAGGVTGAEDAAEEAPVDPTAVRPFEIAVSDEVLADLATRLARTRFPDQVGTDWVYGTDVDYLRELVTYWRDEYDWREQERQLNQFDHFKTRIDDLDIHFIHHRSPEEDALPLLILHGWPGSIVEFMKVIGPLTDPVAHGGQAEDAFHVVAPSLPGYGFSDRPREPGMGPEQIADIKAQLMARLEYDRYGTQGGDWGAVISRWIAYTDAEHVAGLHLNFVMASPPAGAENPMEGVTPEEIQRMQERQASLADATGYTQIQGTKPQTLGYGLNDSPAGLAAWIVEKFHAWCDCQGDLESIFTKDELLTNVMLYWVTETATSAARLYYESRRQAGAGLLTAPPGRVEVPTAGAMFPYELIIPPRRWAEAHYNITRWTQMPRGGHFAAFEQPELLVEDVRAFYRDLR